MIRQVLSSLCAVLLIAAVANHGWAEESPSIEGTYQLVSRKLPDGTMLGGPDIVGLLTYTKTHRNFNLAWKDSTGQHRSYSVVSTYKLTTTEYMETVLLIISNIGISGEGITYTMTGSTQTVPVTMDGGRIEFKMPFDPVSAVFDGDSFIGIQEGVFVDTFQKVR